MADNLPIPSGSDGQLVVTVDSRQAVRGLNAIESRMLRMTQTVNSGLGRSATAFDRFTSFVKKAAAAFAAFITVRTVIGLFDSLISRVIEVDRAFRGFIASMSIIRGSVHEATKEYEFLYAMSNRLGVSVESSISQYHRLAAALKNVDQSGELARHLFSGISQAAVVLHASGRQVTLIFEAIQQMASKGKLSLEELQRQLGNTLPGAVSMAARAMMSSEKYINEGIDTAVKAERRLREEIQKGTINVYEFLTLVAQQLKTEYGEGVDYASKQFTANLNRMRNTVYEFYRQVGDAGATAGLTRIVSEISKLFGESLDGARGLGQTLEVAFGRVADWIATLDASDVTQFFATVQGIIGATGIIVQGFFEMWRGFDGPEMKTPVLNFVQFVASSMAGLMDVISAAVSGIRILLNNLGKMWIDTKNMFTGGEIGESMVNSIDRFGRKFGVNIPGKGMRDAYRATRANIDSQYYENQLTHINLSERAGVPFGDNSMHSQVEGLFENLRNTVNNAGGRTAAPTSDIEEFVNPLSQEALNDLVERIKANSGAPNAGTTDRSAERAFNKQVREFEKLENAVSKWRGEAGITERATEKLRRAQEDLTEATGKLDPRTGELLMTQQEASDIMAMLNEKYREALDPIGFVIEEYDKQAVALRYLGEAADEYTEVLKQQEEWRKGNVKYDEKDIENLRLKIREQQELERMQSAMESVLANTQLSQRGGIDRIRAVGALSRGYEDPEGNMTQINRGQAMGEVVDIFGQNQMEGTREYYDAQFEIYQEFLDRVQVAREEGLLSEQTANELAMESWIKIQEMKLSKTEEFLGYMTMAMQSNNKSAFKAGQAAAIGLAIVDTYKAATGAYAAMASIPYVGPFLGAAAAAAAVVAGMANVSKIRSQQPPGFRTGGSMVVGGGGGHDSKRVSFDATPGEIIQVNTPSQAKAMERIAARMEQDGTGGPKVQNLNVTVVQQGRPDRKTPEQNAKAVRKQALKLMEVD